MTPYLKMGQYSEPGRRARRLVLAAILAAGFSFSGCAGMPTTIVPVTMPPSATVAFCDSSAPSCSGAGTFSLSTMRDLNVSVSWQNLSEGTHTQTLRIFLPDGNLYQAMESSFEIPEASTGAATVMQSVPVIGTWITQRQLTGTWKFTVSLDDQDFGMNSVQLTP